MEAGDDEPSSQDEEVVDDARNDATAAKLETEQTIETDDIDALKASAVEEATTTEAMLTAKIEDGHMLEPEEADALKEAAATKASLTEEALTAKIEAGHMLEPEEVDALKEAAATSASITADKLSEKLESGHMLSPDEMESLKAATATTASIKADALSEKLAQGHMLNDAEMKELKVAAQIQKQHKKTKMPRPPAGAFKETGRMRPMSRSSRRNHHADHSHKGPWVDGGEPYLTLESWASTSSVLQDQRPPAVRASEIYGASDQERKRAQQLERQRLKAAVMEEQQYQQALHRAHMFGGPPPRGRSANTRSRDALLQEGSRPSSRPSSRGNLRPASRGRGQPSSHDPQSQSARAGPVGRVPGVANIPIPPPGPRSARSSTRPMSRELDVKHSNKSREETLINRLQAGHMLSEDELEELRTGAAVDHASDLTSRLQEGHMLSEEEIESLRRASSTAHGKGRASSPNDGGLGPKRSRGSLGAVRSPRNPNRPSQRQALAELQQNALKLIAGGLDIGDMRLSDLVEIRPAHLDPLRSMSNARGSARPRTSGNVRTRAGLSAAYGPASGLPPVVGREHTRKGRL